MARRGRVSASALLIVLAFVSVTQAHWSDDPGTNLALADGTSDQVQPKLVATADGGAYLSWFDNSSGGYDVYLQRLDDEGVEQWAHNGILIADRSFSSTQDYGLSLDTSGNALLVFRDDRTGTTQITASKVAPDGTLLWGSAGVQLSSGTAFHAAPKIAGTSDGGSVAGWTEESSVQLQKLDASGSPQWGDGVTLSDPTDGKFALNGIHASDGTNVIASWVRQGPSFSDPRHIWAQKFASDGTLLWASDHVRVFDGGSIQLGHFPEFITDGGGGAVFSWYSTDPLQVYAQRIFANGTEAFAHNGVTVSTDASHTRVGDNASFDPATQEIFTFWTEMNATQSQWGVYGQKISLDGSRQWTDSGRVLLPIGGNPITQATSELSVGGAVVFYIEELSFGNDRIRATRVDTNGDTVWSPSTVSVSTVVSGKSRLDTVTTPHGVHLLTWEDDRAGDRDVYGQNLLVDGTLGLPCEIVLEGTDPATVEFFAPFHLVTGLLSELTGNGNFFLAECAGVFSTSPTQDPMGDPPVGDGWYYLARGLERCETYGESTLTPDPRNYLNFVDPCP